MAKDNYTGLLVVRIEPQVEDDLEYLRVHGYNVSHWVREMVVKRLPKAKKAIEGVSSA